MKGLARLASVPLSGYLSCQGSTNEVLDSSNILPAAPAELAAVLSTRKSFCSIQDLSLLGDECNAEHQCNLVLLCRLA